MAPAKPIQQYEPLQLNVLRQRCRNENLHMDVLKIVNLIRWNKRHSHRDIKNVLKALEFLMRTDDVTTFKPYQEMVDLLIPNKSSSIQRTTVSGQKNQLLATIREKLGKVFSPTYSASESIDRRFDDESLRMLCLLHLSNKASLTDECRDQLHSLLELICHHSESCDYVIWCLLSILDKSSETNPDHQEIRSIPSFSFDFLSTPGLKICEESSTISIQPEICPKVSTNILQLLSRLAISHPKNFVPSENGDIPKGPQEFWAMVKNEDTSTAVKKCKISIDEKLKQSPMGKLMQYVNKPIVMESDEAMNRLLSVLMATIKSVEMTIMSQNDKDFMKTCNELIITNTHNSSSSVSSTGIAFLSESSLRFQLAPTLNMFEETISGVLNIASKLFSEIEKLLVKLRIVQNEYQKSSKRRIAENLEHLLKSCNVHMREQDCLLKAIRATLKIRDKYFSNYDLKLELNALESYWEMLSKCLSRLKERSSKRAANLLESATLSCLLVKSIKSNGPTSLKDQNDFPIGEIQKFAEKHGEVLNNMILKSKDAQFINDTVRILFSHSRMFCFPVKLKYYKDQLENIGRTRQLGFLSECIKNLEKESDDDKVSQIITACDTTFPLIFRSSDENKHEIQQLAEKYKVGINIYLQKSSGDTPTTVFKNITDHPTLLEFNTKLKYLKKHVDFSSDSLLFTYLSEFLMEYGSLRFDNLEIMSVIRLLFMNVHQRNLMSDRKLFIGFLSQHECEVNRFLQNDSNTEICMTIIEKLINHDWLFLDFYAVIQYLPKAVPIQEEKLKMMWLNQCLIRYENDPFQYSAQEITQSINTLFMSLYDSYKSEDRVLPGSFIDIINQHKTSLKQILYVYIEHKFTKKLFKVLASFPDFITFEHRIRYAKYGLDHFPIETQKELFNECMELLKNDETRLSTNDLTNLLIAMNVFYPTLKNQEEIRNLIIDYARRNLEHFNSFFWQKEHMRVQENIALFFCEHSELLGFDAKIKFFGRLTSLMKNPEIWKMLAAFLGKYKTIEEYMPEYRNAIDKLLARLAHDDTIDNVEKFIDFSKKYNLGDFVAQSRSFPIEKLRVIVTQYPDFLNFKQKVCVLRTELEKMKTDTSEGIYVTRSDLFDTSFIQTSEWGVDKWRGVFHITFLDEMGQDSGGLLREWYTVLARRIFDPNYALFEIAPGDNSSFVIRKTSDQEERLEQLPYFKFIGRVMGKSIMDKVHINCYFTKSFLKHLLNIPVVLEDLESEDPAVFSSLKFIKENPINDLDMGITFSTDHEEFGLTINTPLIDNGSNIEVNDENKMEYVDLVVKMRTSGLVDWQIDAFREGFYDLMPKNQMTLFNEQELELLIAGKPEIDIRDLRANTEYVKCSSTDEHIGWFWKILESFGHDDKAKFLQFATGSPRVPLNGFSHMMGSSECRKFRISMDLEGDARLPSAHTCINQFNLPQYSSYQKMEKSLRYAIRESNEGFGFI